MESGLAATIYDVAARAGASISTALLALNTPGRVRPATLTRSLPEPPAARDTT
jgi:hypothetical protein